MLTEKQIELLASRCKFCQQLAEEEFLPLFCHLCLNESVECQLRETYPEHVYIEVPFFSPLPPQLADQFVVMLWLIYEKTDRTVASWQGVFSVNKSAGEQTLAEKFSNYARQVVPQFARIRDLICAKVSTLYFKTPPLANL
ncbi:MAG: hypothetical protein RMJ44_02465 [Cytophagales bacterium]|nr:hypothetical protein [Bernardetiaceae bacterium]MDW8209925.1 hypothetical protein [Cytophagales bacterium]